MDEDAQVDMRKCISDDQMDTDEGPLINENSNGLSHLLTEGEFNSVDAVGVDESSTSNQGFLNAVELSAGSVGDYLENNTDTFNAESFDVGDNAVNFPSVSLNNVLSDGDSHLSDADFKAAYTSVQATANEQEKECESEASNDLNNLYSEKQAEDSDKQNEEDKLAIEAIQIQQGNEEQPVAEVEEINDSDKQNEEDAVAIEAIQIQQDNLEQPVDEVEEINADQGESNASLAKTNELEENNQEIKSDDNQKQCNLDTSADVTMNSEIGGAGETEVVSEDELPEVQKPSIKDAENVSDDELPGPKPADLPADTEVVSEDELPSSKKDSKSSRKRKPEGEKDDEEPGSPSADSESTNKKQAILKNGESKPIPAEKRPSTEEKPKKKALPELDKYWKVVNDDPTDFTGWTYLLQYVDQETDVEAAREAYDAFLSHYPYCYGYWRKYADYEKKKGSKKKCLDVLERGLKAIPLSVDLWIHYLNHIKTTRPDDHCYIRSQYERAVEACGLEFRSDRLWESYIKWEAENGTPLNVTKIYDRLLATPTLGYTSHFDNFQEHVMSSGVKNVISEGELVRLRGEVRAAGGPAPQLDLPPGEDEPPDHIASEEEAQAIKERIISSRRKVHKTTGEQVALRWTFEEGIKRPYFHVKPLERCQLKNWKSYLEWEKQHGSFKRALVLHERCLIACALYEEFWMRLIKFLGERSESDPSLVALEREALERACTVHHLDKPDLHLHWAHFEELHGHTARAADILERIEKACPNVVQIQYRRINLERRRGDFEKCVQLYESYIASAKSKPVASALSVKYARFLFHVRRDAAAARRALDEAVTRDPLNARLHLQRLDLALHTPDTPYEELDELVQSYSRQEGAELEVSAMMSWRRRELAEELGGAGHARTAALQQRAMARHLRKRVRKDKHDVPPAPSATSSENKKKESSSAPSASTAYYPAAAGAAYDQSYQQSYPPAWGYQQPPPYQHNWPQYPNYY